MTPILSCSSDGCSWWVAPQGPKPRVRGSSGWAPMALLWSKVPSSIGKTVLRRGIVLCCAEGRYDCSLVEMTRCADRAPKPLKPKCFCGRHCSIWVDVTVCIRTRIRIETVLSPTRWNAGRWRLIGNLKHAEGAFGADRVRLRFLQQLRFKGGIYCELT